MCHPSNGVNFGDKVKMQSNNLSFLFDSILSNLNLFRGEIIYSFLAIKEYKWFERIKW